MGLRGPRRAERSGGMGHGQDWNEPTSPSLRTAIAFSGIRARVSCFAFKLNVKKNPLLVGSRGWAGEPALNIGFKSPTA